MRYFLDDLHAREKIAALTNRERDDYYKNLYLSYRLSFLKLMNEKKSRKKAKGIKPKYLIIYIDFLDILPTLSGGALALYIFIGLHANSYGCSSVTILDFCNELKHSEKKANKWLIELVSKGLIHVYESTIEKFLFICPYNSEIRMNDTDSKTVLGKKYKDWIKERKKKNENNKVVSKFWFIPDTFISYMKGLNTEALKLYVYCGLTMDLSYGFLTKARSQITKELGFSSRKIGYCFKELEQKDLVFRQQLKCNTYCHTYILPLYIDYEELEYMDYLSKLVEEEEMQL